MGKLRILDRIRNVVGSIAWKVFLWSIRMTEDEYFEEVYKQEKKYHGS